MTSSKITKCHCTPAVPPSYPAKNTLHATCALLFNLLIVFFPKCPMCWAAYMSLFGGVGLAHIPYMGWLFYLFLGFLGAHLLLLLRLAPQKSYTPFVLCLCGSLVILSGRLGITNHVLINLLGLSLITSSAIWTLRTNFFKGEVL